MLQLQLKRFEYDFMKDMMVKVRCGTAARWQGWDMPLTLRLKAAEDNAASRRLTSSKQCGLMRGRRCGWAQVNDRYEFHDTIDLDREGGKVFCGRDYAFSWGKTLWVAAQAACAVPACSCTSWRGVFLHVAP